MSEHLKKVATLVKDKTVKFIREMEERKIRKRADLVRVRVEAIKKYNDIYHPSVSNALDALITSSEDRFKSSESYVMGEKYGKMKSLLEGYRDFVHEDASSTATTHRFSAYAFQLIDNLGQPMGDVTRRIAQKYKISASSNALLTGALIATRRGGMAAAAAAEGIQAKYEAGAHNAEAESVFSDGMGMMKFSVCVSDLERSYLNFLRISKRFAKYGAGDAKTANRAFFSLVYHGQNCRYEPPDSDSKFIPYLGNEFDQNFSHYIWSPSEAAAHIKNISESNERWKYLASCQDLRSYMQAYYTFSDFLPATKAG